MKITRQTTERIQVGDLMVTVEYGGDGRVAEDDYVMVHACDSKGKQDGKPLLIIEAELLERVAHIVMGRRLAHNDHRYVCSVHGYVEDADCHDCSAEAGKEYVR